MAKGGSGDDALREATEELYGVDPVDFVAARNQLVRRLKAAGDRDLATEVGKLRRPTPAAWAVNQLVRRDRPGVDELVRRGEELRAAQDRALAGAHADDLREAARARRDAVAALSDTAAGFLADRGVGADAHRNQITATLEAASLDAGAAAAVQGGRLSTALEPPSGFGDLEGALTASAVPTPAPSSREASESPDSDARAAAEARRLARGLVTQARTLRERVSRRRRELEEAEAEVATLERRLADARRRRDEAAEAARQAEAAAAQAEAAAEEAQARLGETSS
jgi:hypothetical protein